MLWAKSGRPILGVFFKNVVELHSLVRAAQAEAERRHAQEAAQAAQTQRAAQAEAERRHAQEAVQAAQTRDRQRVVQAEAERQHAQEAAQGTSAKVKRCDTDRRTESIGDSSQESALASALALVRKFYKEGNMTRETCACCNELVSPVTSVRRSFSRMDNQPEDQA